MHLLQQSSGHSWRRALQVAYRSVALCPYGQPPGPDASTATGGVAGFCCPGGGGRSSPEGLPGDPPWGHHLGPIMAKP